MQSIIPVIILFVLFFLNIPIAFSLMGSSLFYFVFLNTTMPMEMVIQQFVTSIESFPYLAVPFFIMMGSIMNYSGISEAYGPGILMTVAMMIVVHIVAVRQNQKPSMDRRATFLEIIMQLIKSIWALLIPFGLIMGMRIGIFTPTEAGAMAVVF